LLQQAFIRMKKVVAILLIVLFVVSVTAATVSAAKKVRKGHATKHVRTGHTAVVKTGHTVVVKTGHTTIVITGSHHRPRDHYYHGHYYPNFDWVCSPH
jgi:hypothetical protein